jgi:hypothetical protein
MVQKEEFCDCGIPEIQDDESCAKCGNVIPEERITLLTEGLPQKFQLKIENRDANENRKIAEMLVEKLSETKKYGRAIKGGDFASFSLVGTKDWEDYASLSLQAVTLLTLTNIDKNLEAIKDKLNKDI